MSSCDKMREARGDVPPCDRPATRIRTWLLFVLPMLLAVGGCGGTDKLETSYGQRLGSAGSSVNGTSVLAGMFEEAGMRVASIKYLSPRIEKYNVLVWFPDDYGMPDDKTREFLESWLANKAGTEGAGPRVLIYVGRDYDAACDYWQSILPEVPADQHIEVMRRYAQARAEHDRSRVDMPKDACCEWMTQRRDFPGERVTQLSGEWSEGVDVAKSQIWSQGRIGIPARQELRQYWKNNTPTVYMQPDYHELLRSGEETLVYEVSKPAWYDGRILVVDNGSFLLNLPLVNRQHRLLAGKLIERCRADGDVAFLESGAGGLMVFEGNGRKTPDAVMRRRVLLAIHWLVFGMIFCFGIYPIFGRPKSLQTETVGDFGQHIDALAALLERTGDEQYAQQQLDLYRRATPEHKMPTRSGTDTGTSPCADQTVNESKS